MESHTLKSRAEVLLQKYKKSQRLHATFGQRVDEIRGFLSHKQSEEYKGVIEEFLKELLEALKKDTTTGKLAESLTTLRNYYFTEEDTLRKSMQTLSEEFQEVVNRSEFLACSALAHDLLLLTARREAIEGIFNDLQSLLVAANRKSIPERLSSLPDEQEDSSCHPSIGRKQGQVLLFTTKKNLYAEE